MKRLTRSVLDALQQLRALLHDRQVRAEVGVEHVLETQRLRAGDHLARRDLARLAAEVLAEGHARGGRRLQHHHLAGLHRLLHAGDVALLHDGAGGAHHVALAAADAFRVLQHVVAGGHHGEAALLRVVFQHVHALQLAARARAALAIDAAAHVAMERVAVIGRLGEHLVHLHRLELCATHQSTALRSLNGSAGHQRLQSLVRSRAGLGAVRPDVHTFLHLGIAGRLDGELVTMRQLAHPNPTL